MITKSLFIRTSPPKPSLHSHSSYFIPRFNPSPNSSNFIHVGSSSHRFRQLFSNATNQRLYCVPKQTPAPFEEEPLHVPDQLPKKVMSDGAIILMFAIVMFLPTIVFSPHVLTSAVKGFSLGCLHTLSRPDHFAAVAPLSIGRTRVESALLAAFWGFGHHVGQLILGLMFFLLYDIEVFRIRGTRAIGWTLLIIGAMGIKEAYEHNYQSQTPCIVLENSECDASAAYKSPPSGRKKKFGVLTFATGIVHALQPDALMMLLPALGMSIDSRLAGFAYEAMFLIGTVFTMGSYTLFIRSCSEALKDRVPKITKKLTWASSLIAIALGVSNIGGHRFGFSVLKM